MSMSANLESCRRSKCFRNLNKIDCKSAITKAVHGMYSACLHLYLITLSERLEHFLFVKWPTCSFLHINYPLYFYTYLNHYLWNEIGNVCLIFFNLNMLSTNTRSNCISDLFNEWNVCTCNMYTVLSKCLYV